MTARNESIQDSVAPQVGGTERKLEMKTFYKWLADGGPVYAQGSYAAPGEWQPRNEGDLEMCKRGYHVCAREQVPYWCGTEFVEVEVEDADVVEVAPDKTLVRSWCETRHFRWTRADMLAYAQWCASRAATTSATFAADAAAPFAAVAAKRAADAAGNAANERQEQLAGSRGESAPH